MGEEKLPLDEEQLPELHKGEVPFFAGERDPNNPDKYGLGYDEAVSTEAAAFTVFSREEAAHLAARLALTSKASITITLTTLSDGKPTSGDVGPDVYLG